MEVIDAGSFEGDGDFNSDGTGADDGDFGNIGLHSGIVQERQRGRPFPSPQLLFG
jgi:hypothetical protein